MIQKSMITVQSQMDIVSARMQVREAARRNGLNLTDQACISMATSSMANILVEGNGSHEGRIDIECVHRGIHTGLQVTCRWPGRSRLDLPVERERWMVDEIELREDSGVLEVILTKWTGK